MRTSERIIIVLGGASNPIPANALLAENGSPLVDESGNYIITE